LEIPHDDPLQADLKEAEEIASSSCLRCGTGPAHTASIARVTDQQAGERDGSSCLRRVLPLSIRTGFPEIIRRGEAAVRRNVVRTRSGAVLFFRRVLKTAQKPSSVMVVATIVT